MQKTDPTAHLHCTAGQGVQDPQMEEEMQTVAQAKSSLSSHFFQHATIKEKIQEPSRMSAENKSNCTFPFRRMQKWSSAF